MNVVEGRTFSAADSTPATPNVILNQAAAAQFFPGQHAVGKHIKMAAAQDWAEIVGVVGSVKDNGLDEDASPQIYVPLGHSPTPSRIAIRTVGNPAQYAALLRREVQAIDSSQPVFDVTTMNVQVATSLEMRRFNMVLLTAFATLALTLAAVGIYGLISYNVTQRTQEIGIRLALGADRYQVLKLMVGTGVRLTVAGLILGTAGFLALSRFMSSLLWGVHAADALTVVCGGAALAIVAVAATYIPSRRATRVDPLVALRYE
jgi:putative ABC transport system permease protein